MTNDNVVEMVRKAVMEEIEGNVSKYEPKMTRAKLRQYEAQGQVSSETYRFCRELNFMVILRIFMCYRKNLI